MTRSLSVAVAILVTLVLTVTPISVVASGQSTDPEITPTAHIIRPLPLNPGPDLTEAPTFVVTGLPEEFSGTMTYPADNMTASGAILTWNHQGSTLQWDPFPIPSQPASSDFVYFYMEFDWEHDKVPAAVSLMIEYTVTTTGDFAGSSFYQLWMWMIDSSDHWTDLFHFTPSSSAELQRDYVSLDYGQIQQAFGGTVVIPPATVQEDPTDTIKVAVGLAPAATIRGQEESVTGTVSVYV